MEAEPCVLVAIGFSVRSLVQALREVQPRCRILAIDAFADLDTAATADHCVTITDWGTEKALIEIAKAVQSAGEQAKFFLAGGCESWPKLLDLLSERPLAGPDIQMIKRLRNREYVNEVNQATADTPSGINVATADSHTDWLMKPINGGGGLGIYRIGNASLTRSKTHYRQRFIKGDSLGVTMHIDQNGLTNIIGMVSHWRTNEWPAPGEFHYRGGILEYPVETSLEHFIKGVGCYLNTSLQLRGIVQLDCIRDEHGKYHLLEFNPRWTSGMELLRYATGHNPLRLQFQNEGFPRDTRASKWCAKAIIYAEDDIEVHVPSILKVTDNLDGWKIAFCDLPNAENRCVSTGCPVLTVRAERVHRPEDSHAPNSIRQEALGVLHVVADLVKEKGFRSMLS